MLVFWNEGLVLLAVPKTGTTALEGALAPHAAMVLRGPPQLKHVNIHRYRQVIQPLLRDLDDRPMETVAVIREPIDWLGSWYRYRHRPELDGHHRSTKGMTFDEFVGEYTLDMPALFARVGSQATFLLEADGKVGVTHLFQYEEQDVLIAFLEERLQIRIKLPWLNASPDVPLHLSAEMEAHLRQERPTEFALWEGARRDHAVPAR